jgi:hypothetical protein
VQDVSLLSRSTFLWFFVIYEMSGSEEQPCLNAAKRLLALRFAGEDFGGEELDPSPHDAKVWNTVENKAATLLLLRPTPFLFRFSPPLPRKAGYSGAQSLI